MKTNNIFMIAAISAFAMAANAQDYGGNNYNYNNDTMASPRWETRGIPGRLFYRNELSLDLFGTASVNEYVVNHPSGSRVKRNGRLGAGFGADYFLTRNFGVGGMAYTENTANNFFDDASGSAIIRFPIDSLHLAPYIFGGGGYQFDTAQAPFAQAGAGLEIRFNRNFGIFVDGRCVLPKKIENYGLGRAGIRITF
jgi:hypothetical protein